MFMTPVQKTGFRIMSLEDMGFDDYAKTFLDSIHPIPEGNRVIAEAVYDVLMTRKMIPNDS